MAGPGRQCRKAGVAAQPHVLSFGERLRRYRIEAGLTQQELAERSGLSVRGLSDLERDVRRAPYADTAQRLADALGLEANDREALLAARRRAVRAPAGQLSEEQAGLPVPLSSFVGREQELAEVQRLLSTTRLLTLVGVGGIGKTRLAVELCRSVAEQYADGVLLVELASLADAGHVPQAVAACLGLRELPRRPLREVLADVLRTRTILLVLDNCEHLVVACGELADTLLRGCPALRVVSTSRERLGIAGETVWRVPSLSVPDLEAPPAPKRLVEFTAVKLFIERARASEPSFAITGANASTVARVCARLDGIPLAIELAAARVSVLTPKQIVERLDDRFRLLTGGSRTAPLRQHTLRATIDWSYDLLNPMERALFERLAVFTGGWTLEAAEAVCGSVEIARGDVLDALAQLIHKSLLLAEPDEEGAARYRMLETLREYATERLAASGQVESTRDRHAAFFLALTEKAAPELLGPRQKGWLVHLEQEHANLRAAIRWLIDRGDCEAARRLGAALVNFWFFRGHLSEGRAWLTELLALAPGAEKTATQAMLLFGSGVLAEFQGDYVASQAPLQESLALWRALDNDVEAAYCLYALGCIAWIQGDQVAARALLEEGLGLGRAVAHRMTEMLILRALADVAYDAGDYVAAWAHAQAALGVARELDWPSTISQALRILGDVSFQDGNLASARSFLEASLAKGRELGERFWVAFPLPRLAQVTIAQRDHARAQAVLAEALNLFQQLGDRQGIVRSLEGHACLAAAQGKNERAIRLAGAAAKLREAIGAPLSAPDRSTLEQWLSPARTALGSDASAVLWRAGQELSVSQAIAFVVSDEEVKSSATRLTPREHEVAALVARGFTNREIGEALVITEGTARVHVEHILAKLDLHARAQLAVWAVERDHLVTRSA